jgi:hypothetical protein
MDMVINRVFREGVDLAKFHGASLRIPSGVFEDLVAVAENAAQLQEIINLAGQSGNQADFWSIAKFLSDKVSLPRHVVRDILDGLAALRVAMERLDLSPEEVVTKIDSSIETEAPEVWKQQHQEKWRQARERIVSALKAISVESPISIQHKARELTYSHQHVLLGARLITDLRPVFDAGATRINTMVLTHVLSVDYQDGQTVKRIEFALDAGDVAKLRQSVERAQQKTETARKLLEDKSVALIIAGRPDVDSEAE